MINEAEELLREELQESERVLWSGRPELWPLLGGGDVVWMPIGLMWVGLGLGPTIDVLRGDYRFGFELMFVFFLLAGLYLLAGRFVLKILARRRTFYAVTTKRVLVLRMFPRKSLRATYIDSIAGVTKEVGRGGRGTITLGNNPMWRAAEDMEFLIPPFGAAAPVLINIRDVERVFKLIDSLMAGARQVPGVRDDR